MAKRGRKPDPWINPETNQPVVGLGSDGIQYQMGLHKNNRQFYIIGWTKGSPYLGTETDPPKAISKFFDRIGANLGKVPTGTSPSMNTIKHYQKHPEQLKSDPLVPIFRMDERVQAANKLKQAEDATLEGWEKGTIGEKPFQDAQRLHLRLRSKKEDLEEQGKKVDNVTDLMIPDISSVEHYKRILLWHLANNPDFLADLTGYPQFRYFKTLQIPGKAKKLVELWDIYNQKTSSTDRKRRMVVNKYFIGFCLWMEKKFNVTSLDQITAEQLDEFRKSVMSNDSSLRSAITEATRKQPKTKNYRKPHNKRDKYTVHGQCGIIEAVRSVFKVSRKANPSDTLLININVWCKDVLPVPRRPKSMPKGISKEHLQQLLEALKDNPKWTAMVMLAVNGCLKNTDIAEAKVQDLHLETFNGTKPHYWKLRPKELKMNIEIPQGFVLLPETVEALERWLAIRPQNTDFLFPSEHTKWAIKPESITTQLNNFRVRFGLPKEITFESLTQGAYNVAKKFSKVPDRFLNLLKGHQSGCSLNYSYPEISETEPAVETIGKYFFGSEAQEPTTKRNRKPHIKRK